MHKDDERRVRMVRVCRERKSFPERYRIVLSRWAAAFFLLLLFMTHSCWRPVLWAETLFYFSGVFLVSTATLGRMWCSLYIAGHKDRRLATDGPYSLCRHPLYLFSLLGAVGVGLASRTLVFPLLIGLFFSLYYPRVIRAEERRLLRLFPVEYSDYRDRVPAFFPRWTGFHETRCRSINPVVYRRHLFSAAWFLWLFFLLDWAGRLVVLAGFRVGPCLY